jgi:Glucose/sorbosone dehydrogenases
MRLRALLFGTLLAAALVAGPVAARDLIVRTEAGSVKLTEVASGLQNPWSLAFLPDGRMLVTERPGQMRIVGSDGSVSAPIAGVPEVHARGQGGLLDVAVSPNFADDKLIVFSYAEPTAGGARTAVARARLDAEGLQLEDVRRIFAQNEDPSGNHHWGSRLVFARDGTLFITLGDRFHSRERAQALDSHLGKVVRIAIDGSAPADNPLAGRSDARPEIWSWGHRNVQGAALHPQTGELWTHEHGPQGGDEINRTRAGLNYGWPEVTYGREYVTGRKIGEGEAREGVEPPVLQFTPSIAPRAWPSTPATCSRSGRATSSSARSSSSSSPASCSRATAWCTKNACSPSSGGASATCARGRTATCGWWMKPRAASCAWTRPEIRTPTLAASRRRCPPRGRSSAWGGPAPNRPSSSDQPRENAL